MPLPRHSTHHRSFEEGFTIMELIMVVVVIGIITSIALPSMKSVVRRQEDLDVSSHLVQTINTIRDQAVRRNKAYAFTLMEMEPSQPQGLVRVQEAAGNTCQSILEKPEDAHEVAYYSYGLSHRENALRPHSKNAGLIGVRAQSKGPLESDEKTFCFNSNGALYVKEGALYSELIGIHEIAVQLFMGEVNWSSFGPPRIVKMTFSSGAQLQQK